MALSLSLHILGLSLQLWRAEGLVVEGCIPGAFGAPQVPERSEETPTWTLL